jgi:hypothetical protein
MKIRSPSFCNLSILGSLDFVMGECDR